MRKAKQIEKMIGSNDNDNMIFHFEEKTVSGKAWITKLFQKRSRELKRIHSYLKKNGKASAFADALPYMLTSTIAAGSSVPLK